MFEFDFKQGKIPLLVSMPHSGLGLCEGLEEKLTDSAKSLPDTDWHIPRLYDFVSALGASVIKANYSRFVIDLNRPPDNQSLYPGQAGTGLCPVVLFSGENLYLPGQQPTQEEITNRLETYWQPYHDKLKNELERIRSVHGYVILYDAHSIRSEVPRLFDNRLPDLNVGTVHQQSCAPAISNAIRQQLETDNNYSYALNARFVGGYITRHYGAPKENVHAIQMELSQLSYMDEESFTYLPEKADQLKQVLQKVFSTLLNSTTNMYNQDLGE